MLDQLQNLADSKNAALLLSLIANVGLAWALLKLFQKREANIDSKERLYLQLLRRQLEEKTDGAKDQISLGPDEV